MMRMWTRSHRALLGTTLALGLLGLAASACSPDPDKELARATIGPEGGTLQGGALTIEFPPGAIAVETELRLIEVDRKLVAGDFAQKGKAYAIEPAELRLRLPAEATISAELDAASVLVEWPSGTVAFSGTSAYLDRLGTLALAEAGTQSIQAIDPVFEASPSAPGQAHVDNLHVELQLENTHRVDLRIVAWDYSLGQGVLNGDNGVCGFKLAQLEGGSLTTGCAGGELSASINAAGDHVSFTILPLHAPALDEPVSVGIIASDDQLGYSLGYFAFSTGSCYLEECSGHGTCEPNDPPTCACDEGFAPPDEDPLACACVPQCDGRECGGDSCGGSCGDCGPDEECIYGEGICQPAGGETTDATTDSDSSSDTSGDTSDSTSDSTSTDSTSTDSTSSDTSTT
jgi:hypothetical protein